MGWEMAELKNRQQQEMDSECNVTHTWYWWDWFRFLDGFNSISPFEETSQGYLGSSSFFIIIDDMLVLDCILNGCCSLHVLFYLQALHLKNSQSCLHKKIPSPFPASWISLVLQLLLSLVSFHPFSGHIHIFESSFEGSHARDLL